MPLVRMISRLYNERMEDIFTRILYFFNTIDTYFVVAGFASFVIAYRGNWDALPLAVGFLFAFVTAKIADFFPVFPLLAIPCLLVLGAALGLSAAAVGFLLLINVILFFGIQFLFMGIPDSIVARDIRVPFIKMYNSLFTLAPTTVSFSMSVFFSFYLSFCLLVGTSLPPKSNYAWLGEAAYSFC